MAAAKDSKEPKVMDVTHPSKVTPSATSRPIIVTKRSIMTSDPMMMPNGPSDGEPANAAEPMTRTAKTIIPLSAPEIPETKAKEKTPAAAKTKKTDAKDAKPAPEAKDAVPEATPPDPEPAAGTPCRTGDHRSNS